MIELKRIVLDVLKPHSPSILEFARTIAESAGDCRVDITVVAVDEKTESVTVVIEGRAIVFEAVTEAINTLGGSIHSLDEVSVAAGGDDAG